VAALVLRRSRTERYDGTRHPGLYHRIGTSAPRTKARHTQGTRIRRLVIDHNPVPDTTPDPALVSGTVYIDQQRSANVFIDQSRADTVYVEQTHSKTVYRQ